MVSSKNSGCEFANISLNKLILVKANNRSSKYIASFRLMVGLSTFYIQCLNIKSIILIKINYESLDSYSK